MLNKLKTVLFVTIFISTNIKVVTAQDILYGENLDQYFEVPIQGDGVFVQ